jgi:hypothetical protein
MDGICAVGANSAVKASEEIMENRGWDSLEELRKHIVTWATKARPGQCFRTHFSVIVCNAVDSSGRLECEECLSTDLEFWMLAVNEEEQVVQRIQCRNCNRMWDDIFELTDRKVIEKGHDTHE